MKKDSILKNRAFVIANLAMFINLFIGHFVPLPEALRGFLCGGAIVCYILSIYDFRRGEEALCRKKSQALAALCSRGHEERKK